MESYKRIKGKLISLEEVEALLTPEFRKKRKIVFTNGCFDVLHRGHIHYLAKARDLGDLLVVGLNSDGSVRRLKGEGRPVNDEHARAEVLGALEMVDHIILFHEETPLNLINTVRPDLLVKGGDYREEEIVGYREVTAMGGKVTTIPLLEGYSTSSIIDRT